MREENGARVYQVGAGKYRLLSIVMPVRNFSGFSIIANLKDLKERKPIGFALVVTDEHTFAYLCDVDVAVEHRGHGP